MNEELISLKLTSQFSSSIKEIKFEIYKSHKMLLSFQFKFVLLGEWKISQADPLMFILLTLRGIVFNEKKTLLIKSSFVSW